MTNTLSRSSGSQFGFYNTLSTAASTATTWTYQMYVEAGSNVSVSGVIAIPLESVTNGVNIVPPVEEVSCPADPITTAYIVTVKGYDSYGCFLSSETLRSDSKFLIATNYMKNHFEIRNERSINTCAKLIRMKVIII